MTDPFETIVRRAVAEHLGMNATPFGRLDRIVVDFGLQPLDMVLIAIRIEEREKITLPTEELEHVRTVAQLGNLVRRVHMAAEHDGPALVPFTRPGCTAKRRSWLRRLVA